MKSSTTIALAALACLVCIAVNVIVWSNWDPTYINNDGVQYLSTAFNWLAGHGISTNALMFTPHFQGTVPAPQTVWPPGYPALIAIASLFGLTIYNAGLILNLFFLVVGAILMLLIFLRWEIKLPLALFFTLLFYISAMPWTYAMALLSEPTFNVLILATILILPKVNEDKLWPWIVSGILIALCITVRYSGVLFAVGVGFGTFFYCLVNCRSNPRCLIRLIGLMALQQSVAIAVFLLLQYRTFSLTGTLRRQAGIKEPETLYLTIKQMVWQVRELLGFTKNGAVPVWLSNAMFILFVLVFTCVLIYVLYVVLTSADKKRTSNNEYTGIAVYVLLGHGAVFILFFTVSSMGSNNVDLTHRYLYQIGAGMYILFCLLITKTFNRMSVDGSTGRPGLFRNALVTLCCLFLMAQLNFVFGIPAYADPGRNTQAILALPVTEEIELKDMIQACFENPVDGPTTENTGTLWSNEGQLLHLHSLVPTLSIAQVYANEPFDLDQMADNIDMYNIKMLVFIRGLYDTEPQFAKLMGEFKQWLVNRGHLPQPMFENRVSDTVSIDVFVVDQSCLVTS